MSDDHEEIEESVEKTELIEKKNHKKYRKDKPWDNDSIDHWKVDEWKPTDKLPGTMHSFNQSYKL